MLEQLRLDMIQIFHHYYKQKSVEREKEWEAYCFAREKYLQECCRISGKTYKPLGFIRLGH